MITEQQARDAAEQYREEGYALLRGFIDPEEVAHLQSETARIYEAGMQHPSTWRHGNLCYEILPEEDFGRRYVIQAYWMAWVSDYFERLRRSEPFRLVLEPILGPDIRQVTQQIHWKPPGAGLTGYRFHQDLRFREVKEAYRDIETSSINAGLAIDPSARENGCLQVVPGSQKLGYVGLSDEGDGQIMKGLTAEDELRAKGIDPDSIVWLEMEPGDLALWGLMTVHGSLPNTSDHDRAFLISSYVRADSSDRGEWAFRGGQSIPLGDAPSLCKYEKLYERPEPHYVNQKWYA
ncbi:phytanoyl-CoA dioxygenase family protein [Pseudoruegeria sp. HB172150]|uniref:phytanoyl-CoA dioxygenase family protein n=1 Tax=Pseudoruegeria sp. HB172150 TaxID=2721164 RepID=UPI0015534F10|nr:phytanoyl-CoA dioxygenase family protein [Pseudoruegeria sp. HB172150]